MAPGSQHGLDITSLDGAIQHFCSQGIAPSTYKTYQAALKKFAIFCSTYDILSPFPVSESVLCYFATYLACKHLSPQTVKVYLEAIQHMQIMLGLPEPQEYSLIPRLRLSGIQRSHSQTDKDPAKVRLPITPSILYKLKAHWFPCNTNPDIVMFWAAATLCLGFFRVGEITVPNLSAFDQKKHLAWGDVAIDNPESPQTLRVHLKRSKTDQLGKGIDVFIGKTECPLCPVKAVLNFIAIQGVDQGPSFKFKSGNPLTKAAFTQHVRAALQAVGLPESQFAGHSFRIGATTTAASAGVEDSTIRMLGRWSSSAFLQYIRTPRQQLANFSKPIAACHLKEKAT